MRAAVHPPAHPSPFCPLRSTHVRTRRLRARGMDPAALDAGGKTASNPWGGQNVRAQAPRQSSIFDAHRSIRMAHRSFIHPALHSHVSPACVVAESKSLCFLTTPPHRVSFVHLQPWADHLFRHAVAALLPLGHAHQDSSGVYNGRRCLAGTSWRYVWREGERSALLREVRE